MTDIHMIYGAIWCNITILKIDGADTSRMEEHMEDLLRAIIVLEGKIE